MSEPPADSVRSAVDAIYRSDSRRVLASLIRLLGDFDLAEDALQEAFAAALKQWPASGVPANPRAWLVSTGRFKAIDSLRRRARLDTTVSRLVCQIDDSTPMPEFDRDLEDDRLRLVFTCCHPALGADAQTALTLREVCGLSTEEIARAFMTTPSNIAQRIVRAKAKIREAGIPYAVPEREELPARLEVVLRVVYLLFNEGYSASAGAVVTRGELSGEAIRLGRLLAELLPDPEVLGLLALMLFQESRRDARLSPEGEIVLLADQDRARWNRACIEEGVGLLKRALSMPEIGTYTLQAAIAAEHAQAVSAPSTDWSRIVGWYDLLLEADPSPVVELNRAVAVAMRDGPEEGLAIVDNLLDRGELGAYAQAHVARGEFCRRLGRTADARDAYEEARRLTHQEPERRLIERRLAELRSKAG